MTDDSPKPTRCTKVSGGRRSLQYYALRTGLVWTMSEKSRCWTTVMRGAWSNELDAITLLGIEPKPAARDWRRFEETRELVDLGRNRATANRLLGALETEASTEISLRYTAERDLANTVTAEMADLVAKGRAESAKAGEDIETYGLDHTIRFCDFDDRVKAGYMAHWGGELGGSLAKATAYCKTTSKSRAALVIVLAEYQKTIEEKLLAGEGAPTSYDQIGRAACALWHACAINWRKLLVARIEEAGQIEEAHRTLANRKLQMDLARCERGIHDWIRGDKLAEDCGCPADPGIHGCQPNVCRLCGTPEPY